MRVAGWPSRTAVGLDTDTVELTVKTLSSHLITGEFNFPVFFYGRHTCPCRQALIRPIVSDLRIARQVHPPVQHGGQRGGRPGGPYSKGLRAHKAGPEAGHRAAPLRRPAGVRHVRCQLQPGYRTSRHQVAKVRVDERRGRLSGGTNRQGGCFRKSERTLGRKHARESERLAHARNLQAQVKCTFREQYRNMRYWFDQVSNASSDTCTLSGPYWFDQ
eukprot:1183114-Prorocentrum_minimum.AAC.3